MTGSYFKADFKGSKRERTTEGFLLCRDVRVARTGEMLYAAGEVPVEPGISGLIKISRDASVLFDPITIQSGLGKSVTIQHPEEDVDPKNWREFEVGTALSCSQGRGADSEYLLMDLMVKDSYAIEQIENGLIEISLGYDAAYHEMSSGIGYQTDMIINHVALVERGRCGSSCAVRDEQTINDIGKKMARSNERSNEKPRVKTATGRKAIPRAFKQLFRDAFRTADAEEFEEIMDAAAEEFEKANESTESELEDEETFKDLGPNSAKKLLDLRKKYKNGEIASSEYYKQSAILSKSEDNSDGGEPSKFNDDALQEHIDKNQAEHDEFRARLEALEKATGAKDESGGVEGALDDGEDLEQFLEDEAPEGVDPDEAKGTKDSRYLVDSLMNTISLAEIIAPGIQIPTADSANPAKKTASSICALRKKALKIAQTNDCAAIVHELTGGKGVKAGMTCDAARLLFNAVAANKRAMNRGTNFRAKDHLDAPEKPEYNRAPTPSDMNKLYKQIWGKK